MPPETLLCQSISIAARFICINDNHRLISYGQRTNPERMGSKTLLDFIVANVLDLAVHTDRSNEVIMQSTFANQIQRVINDNRRTATIINRVLAVMLNRILNVASCAPHFDGCIIQEVQLACKCHGIDKICRRRSRCVPSRDKIVHQDRITVGTNSVLPRRTRIKYIATTAPRRSCPTRRIDVR